MLQICNIRTRTHCLAACCAKPLTPRKERPIERGQSALREGRWFRQDSERVIRFEDEDTMPDEVAAAEAAEAESEDVVEDEAA